MPDRPLLQELSVPGDVDLVAFIPANGETPAALPSRLPGLFAESPSAAAAAELQARDARLPGAPPTAFPPSGTIGLLLYPPAPGAPLVVRRSALERVGRPRPVDDPIRDWLIRASLAGETIVPLPASAASGEGSLPRLLPARPPAGRDWLLEHLRKIDPARCLTADDPISATAFHAGLYLWHDYLDECHKLAQSIEGEGRELAGDYWHGIMHRREPNYTNAKYWFQRLPAHPVFPKLAKQATAILAACPDPAAARWRERLLPQGGWDPFAFIDLCEACAGDEEAELALAARRIQLAEMSLLIRR